MADTSPITVTLDDLAAELSLPKQALARLCQHFKLPKAAYQGDDSGLFSSQRHGFSPNDVANLRHIHQRLVAGEALTVITKAWEQSNGLTQRGELPTPPSFLHTLKQARHTTAAPPTPANGDNNAVSVFQQVINKLPPSEPPTTRPPNITEESAVLDELFLSKPHT